MWRRWSNTSRGTPSNWTTRPSTRRVTRSTSPTSFPPIFSEYDLIWEFLLYSLYLRVFKWTDKELYFISVLAGLRESSLLCHEKWFFFSWRWRYSNLRKGKFFIGESECFRLFAGSKSLLQLFPITYWTRTIRALLVVVRRIWQITRGCLQRGFSCSEQVLSCQSFGLMLSSITPFLFFTAPLCFTEAIIKVFRVHIFWCWQVSQVLLRDV